MIQAAPPPAQHCVKAAEVTSGSTYLTVSGEPAQVAAVLADARRLPEWQVETDVTSKGVRFARLKADLNVPYRSIGGLIYLAQTRHVAVAMTTDPLICETEEN